MMSSSTDEYLSLLPTLSLALAGVNIVWGIFLYPWGLIGFVFAAVDIGLFFLALKIKEDYDSRTYEFALKKLGLFVPLGFVCGLIILGIISLRAKMKIEERVTKKYLIRATPEKIFTPPQFPGKKN
jgi:uncharacterized membrane protein YciS (DUF1049 family)